MADTCGNRKDDGCWPAGRPTPSLSGVPFVCSWSGGKDSCLAFHAAVAAGGVPTALISMADETGVRTRSHALPIGFVCAQAAALGVPLIVRAAGWEDYETQFIEGLREATARGAQVGVFGDIDIDDHRLWEEKVCAAAGLRAFLPLWQRPRRELLDDVFALGMTATIVTTEARFLDGDFIGRELTSALVDMIEAHGADAAGELGEYHTAVTYAPLFTAAVPLGIVRPYRAAQHWHAEFETLPVAANSGR